MSPRDYKVGALAARVHGRRSAICGQRVGDLRGMNEAYALAARAILGDREARREILADKLALRRVLLRVRESRV